MEVVTPLDHISSLLPLMPLVRERLTWVQHAYMNYPGIQLDNNSLILQRNSEEYLLVPDGLCLRCRFPAPEEVTPPSHVLSIPLYDKHAMCVIIRKVRVIRIYSIRLEWLSARLDIYKDPRSCVSMPILIGSTHH